MNLIFTTLLLSFCESRFIKRHTTGNFDLSIIHTNDIHSHYDQTNKFGTDCTEAQIIAKQCYGGIPRLKATIDQLRREHPNSLLLDAGDQFQGTLFYSYYKGNVTVEIMNLLKYDAMALGNHEFDDGPSNIARVANLFNFPIVSSNIDAKLDPALGPILKPYTIIEKYNLGIIGYITPTLASISNSGPTLQIVDPIAPVQRAIDELQAKGIKRIIAVSHNGYHEDVRLAENTRGLSLIVGGHSHTYLAPASNQNDTSRPQSGGLYPTEVRNLENENTYVVQAYCWGRFLGHVDINFKENGYLQSIEGAPIELGDDIQPDAEALELVKKWRKPFDEMAQEIIGSATGDFDQASCHSQECSMGNLITDIILDSRKAAGTNFAIMNSGGIRAGLGVGDIQVQQVLVAFPFGNAVLDMELSGQKIWETLEGVVSAENQLNHLPVTAFVQVSGLKFKYDVNQPKGQRLVFVEIQDPVTNEYSQIDLKKTYKVATIDFISKGGDNILAPPVDDLALLEQLDQLMISYIKNAKTIVPKIEGRIQAVDKSSFNASSLQQPNSLETRSDTEASNVEDLPAKPTVIPSYFNNGSVSEIFTEVDQPITIITNTASGTTVTEFSIQLSSIKTILGQLITKFYEQGKLLKLNIYSMGK
ncbi:Metallo-dependent phosphatase [Conidiobolus coronatus NRRL 28638]|uniref:Metallo-dependent phosphatase n=1 Tax=Conidiobolus coronatus (strain ATCC 28846 / CBS 209.66 / NRRL 28638) TaxID=796925 RepID=A0A137P006_CONC2|nr:Metallo-dependent phosphatase [Conidiobolus coronatus NRRL 28638]|eukprot:KXN68189.1 Metallo-dependent phosphatase [Conidiobolus coronatus NRRL 28638]